MKPDMPKQFAKSSGRPKGRFPRNSKKLSKPDEQGETLDITGMKRVHRFANKFAESNGPEQNFPVLRRFLMGKRGQLWDKVYSEICAEADDRSFTGHNFREWLGVEQNCHFDEEGKLVNDRGLELKHWTGYCFYVHPELKTLEFIDKKRTHNREDWPQAVFEIDGVFYHKHDGLWYRVRMENIPITTRNGYSYPDFELAVSRDVFITQERTLRVLSWSLARLFRKTYSYNPYRQWYCVWKQSANRREITKLKKKYNLAN